LDFDARADLLSQVGTLLREQIGTLAALATQEMGRPLSEARHEIEKCALVCDFYAVHAEPFLEEERIPTDAGKSYVRYEPLGVILGVMPWNFPFWQVFRFAAPALMGGNAVALKHAPNVQMCAQAIERILTDAGLPRGLFVNLPIEVELVERALAHPAVRAIAVTGSERTGRIIAALAGAHLKKTVLELGGSDPFVVLADADIELAAARATHARFTNTGQACIAAKRFIVVPEIADAFVAAFRARIAALRVGDPASEHTQIGPLARSDLRDQLHQQVEDALACGALKLLGCHAIEGRGYYYAPSLIDHLPASAVARQEELFGPVAVVIRAGDEEDAVRIANETRFGLGASVWGRDYQHAEQVVLRIESGLAFVNGVVKSDLRLPFGGIKASGFGRELSFHGTREFCQPRTVWIRDGWTPGTERRRGDRRRGDRRTG
jgi:succinate-semialdehyde dehydrogenase/glutarate-semialdehyde dehydrogenase